MKDNQYVLLIAEDSEDDALLIGRALRKAGLEVPVRMVPNGEEVIRYLEGAKPYSDRDAYPMPALLLLDIKMPRLNGLEVLKWFTTHPQYRVVPTIMFSSSKMPSDVKQSYALGANGFFVKGSDPKTNTEIFQVISQYWKFNLKLSPTTGRPLQPSKP